MTRPTPMVRDCSEAYHQELSEVALECACAHVLEGVPLDFIVWHARQTREIANCPGFESALTTAIDCERQRIAEGEAD